MANQLDFKKKEDLDNKIIVEDEDFDAVFEKGKWTVKWNWSQKQLPQLITGAAEYKMSDEVRVGYEKEVNRWIAEGWLVPYSGERRAILPLMAVVQHNKDKVRPVLDYRKLNEFIDPHTGDSDVCGEKLRKWRCMGTNLKMLDLKNAYLQVHLNEEQWKYQTVLYKGKRYCLTRLGFGLNVAPKIMTCIVNKVLSFDQKVCEGTDSYIDDIIVNEDVVKVEEVMAQLSKYGLEFKTPESVIEGTRILGLHVKRTGDKVMWKRDNSIESEMSDKMTKRQLFSICGRLTGHYPVCEWLRPACSFVKRLANDQGWNDVANQEARTVMEEILTSVRGNDPVKGVWNVSTTKGRLWCDASSLATGAALEVDGNVVEDGCWLRKVEDHYHINVAELDSIIKGMSIAKKWDISHLDIMTDSASVFAWLNSIVHKDKKINNHGISELLVQRRLAILEDIFAHYQFQVTICKVTSAENKADQLTRVPKKWLVRKTSELENTIKCNVAVADINTQDVRVRDDAKKTEIVKQVHSNFHAGIQKTKFMVDEIYPELKVSNEIVKKVVNHCNTCQSIDPAPVKWERGKLDVEETWERVANDVTHYGDDKYFTFVDCGPSRYAVWRKIENESAATICNEARFVFSLFGPPKELLVDNYLSYHSEAMTNLCNEWGTKIVYRCANRPSGNGIVERNHRTIKRRAARSDGDIMKSVYWYNALPKKNLNASPSKAFLGRKVRYPIDQKLEECDTKAENTNSFTVGDFVYVKPGNVVKCTSKWPIKRVTGLTRNPVVAEIEGIPHHVADIRLVRNPSQNETKSIDLEIEMNAQQPVDSGQNEWTLVQRRRPTRERNPVTRFGIDDD
jgi:ribonuclease HI